MSHPSSLATCAFSADPADRTRADLAPQEPAQRNTTLAHRKRSASGSRADEQNVLRAGKNQRSDTPQNAQSSCTESRGTSGSSSNPHARALTGSRRSRITLRRRASFRLRDLYALADYRWFQGFCHDPQCYAFVLAATLACGEPGFIPIRGSNRSIPWHGLDMLSLREAVRCADLGSFSDAELATIISDVERWQRRHGVRLISAKRCGEMLQLTAHEREVCGIRTIDAIDEPRAERQARIARERRARDKAAKRSKRGRLLRSEYEDRSLSRSQPWKAEGISRATWYRRRRSGLPTPETSLSPLYISIEPQPTHLSQGLQSVRLAGPASIASEAPHHGADVPSAHGLPEKSSKLTSHLFSAALSGLRRYLVPEIPPWQHEGVSLSMGALAHG
jgi:hypothetical protein